MIKELKYFLEGINTKQEQAWEHLYADYYSPLCCYALKILKDRELVRDVVQGVIIRLWEADLHFADLPSFHGYLYKSVYNNSLKVLRDKNIEDHYLAVQESREHIVPEELGEAIIEEEVVRRLRSLIDRMPEKRREVMLLCMEEKKVEEISQILGISVNTVKKHKKEAYESIRHSLPADMLVLFFLFS